MSAHYQNGYSPEIFDFPVPLTAIDIVIFTIYKKKLCVVLRTMEDGDGKIHPVLPGAIIKKGLSLEENFDDILKRQTWIEWVYREQLSVFWDPGRDHRGHVISISFLSLINKDDFLNDADFTRIQIVEYAKLDTQDIAHHFDHKKIIHAAKSRLNYKLEYTKIAKNLVPKAFTLPYLHSIYEIILGETIDQRNFRKKILFLGIVRETGELDTQGSRRPAKLYEFTNKEIEHIDIL